MKQTLSDMIEAASKFQDAVNPLDKGFDEAIEHALSNAMQQDAALDGGEAGDSNDTRAQDVAPDAGGMSTALGLDLSDQQRDDVANGDSSRTQDVPVDDPDMNDGEDDTQDGAA